jgi:biopolymer transport protein ExbD
VKRTRNQGGILPFLDLLFILLFSLLALSETKKSSSQEPVRIRLPQVEPGESEQPEENRPTIVLEIDAESRIRLEGDDDPVDSPEELDRKVGALLAGRTPEECRIEIHGDQDARHGVGVGLLQHLRRAGFGSVTLLATGSDGGNWTKGDAR